MVARCEFSHSVPQDLYQYQTDVTLSTPYITDANVILSSIDGVSSTLKLPIEMCFFLLYKHNLTLFIVIV